MTLHSLSLLPLGGRRATSRLPRQMLPVVVEQEGLEPSALFGLLGPRAATCLPRKMQTPSLTGGVLLGQAARGGVTRRLSSQRGLSSST
jgi:hypothetical protein